jgi:hypothetical protein
MPEITEQQTDAPPDYGPGLRQIRRRRWFLWLEILVYLPMMIAVMKLMPTNGALAVAFGIWFVLLWFVVGYSALARCPRCGNYYHMHGMTLLYIRRCLHCQLRLTADKKRRFTAESATFSDSESP